MKKVLFFGFVFSCFILTGIFSMQKDVFAQTDPCVTGGSGTCEIPTSGVSCPDGREYLGSSQTCSNMGSPLRICCRRSAGSNACTSNCGTGGSCACATSTNCTSPRTIVSAGNAFCNTQTAGNICCKTPTEGDGGTTPEKCKEGFEEKSGVCFPMSNVIGLSDTPVATLLVNLMKWMLYLFGFLAIIAFVISGIQYLAAAGNMNMIETAKRNMTWSIVGVIVALAGLVIIIAIDALLRGTAWGG